MNGAAGDRMATPVVATVHVPPAVATSPATVAPVPVVVPANWIWHVVVVHEIVVVPTFLMLIENAPSMPAETLPVKNACVTSIVEFAVAEPISPEMEAATTPPAAKTAATMMNKSMLWLIAFLRLFL